jgi:biofilm protein TabA
MNFSSLACSLFILTPILSIYGQQQSTKGLKLTMHRSVNKDSFDVAYHNNQNAWDAAFAFLKNTDLAEQKPGNYPILGDQVFAIVTEGPSHPKDSVKWESHKHYVDLHYVIKGKEMIGIAETAKAIVTKPYTPDVINYTAEGKYYMAKPGEFFLFFPNDAHRPGIKIAGYDIVKKIVIKIATGY